jgi:hypothetical protein
MVGVRKIEQRVREQDHQFLMFTQQSSSEWMVVGLDYHTFSHPLPKLFLRCPKLLLVRANYQCSLLLSVFLFVGLCAHPFVRPVRTEFSLYVHGPCFLNGQGAVTQKALNGETSSRGGVSCQTLLELTCPCG